MTSVETLPGVKAKLDGLKKMSSTDLLAYVHKMSNARKMQLHKQVEFQTQDYFEVKTLMENQSAGTFKSDCSKLVEKISS